jgi:glycosyltransferase involved in cell wall biosynthesis
MRIGVAIPCYKYHIPVLKRCLDSIERQTYKPDEVIVSCSSCMPTDIPTYNYSFPLRIITRPERRNAAENRNLAAAELMTDIVSFFDCDDEMHPQRIEYIAQAFERSGCGIVLHNFFENDEVKQPFLMNEQLIYVRQKLYPSSWCAILENEPNARIHHSQVSVAKDIMKQIQYKEDIYHERREDSTFCADVLRLPGIKNVYIRNALSNYFKEGMTHR